MRRSGDTWSASPTLLPGTSAIHSNSVVAAMDALDIFVDIFILDVIFL